MKNYGLAFHHLGLASREKVKALRFLEGLRYKMGETVYDHLQKVNLIMGTSEIATMPDVEIIFPGREPGPLDKILTIHSELFYHICYEAENIENSVQAIKEDKNRIFPVSKPKPAVLFSNRRVGFYKVVGFGLIEILEKA